MGAIVIKANNYVMFLALWLVLLCPLNMYSQEKPEKQAKKKEKKPREKDLLSLEFTMNYSMVLGKYSTIE